VWLPTAFVFGCCRCFVRALTSVSLVFLLVQAVLRCVLWQCQRAPLPQAGAPCAAAPGRQQPSHTGSAATAQGM
jgi:hypothetical protein